MIDRDRTPDLNPTPDLIPLIGHRLLHASEPEKGDQWQEGLIKQLTAGEPVETRPLHGGFTEVAPDFTLRISGRHTSGSEDPGQ